MSSNSWSMTPSAKAAVGTSSRSQQRMCGRRRIPRIYDNHCPPSSGHDRSDSLVPTRTATDPPGAPVVAIPPWPALCGGPRPKGHGAVSGGVGAGFCSRPPLDGPDNRFLTVKSHGEARRLRAEGRIFQVESHHKSHQRTAGLKRGSSDIKLQESCKSLQFGG